MGNMFHKLDQHNNKIKAKASLNSENEYTQGTGFQSIFGKFKLSSEHPGCPREKDHSGYHRVWKETLYFRASRVRLCTLI